MNREEFVAAMVAELEVQASDEANWNGRALNAQEVYQQLCYDMPAVTAAELDVLDAALMNLGTLTNGSSSITEDIDWFRIHPKFVYNTLALSTQVPDEATKTLHGAACRLVGSVLLRVPLYLLRCVRASAQIFFPCGDQPRSANVQPPFLDASKPPVLAY